MCDITKWMRYLYTYKLYKMFGITNITICRLKKKYTIQNIFESNNYEFVCLNCEHH